MRTLTGIGSGWSFETYLMHSLCTLGIRPVHHRHRTVSSTLLPIQKICNQHQTAAVCLSFTGIAEREEQYKGKPRERLILWRGDGTPTYKQIGTSRSLPMLYQKQRFQHKQIPSWTAPQLHSLYPKRQGWMQRHRLNQVLIIVINVKRKDSTQKCTKTKNLLFCSVLCFKMEQTESEPREGTAFSK